MRAQEQALWTVQKLILPPRVALLRAHCRLAAAVPVGASAVMR